MTEESRAWWLRSQLLRWEGHCSHNFEIYLDNMARYTPPLRKKKKKITTEYLSSKSIIYPTLNFSKKKSLRNQESTHKQRKVGRTAYSFIMKQMYSGALKKVRCEILNGFFPSLKPAPDHTSTHRGRKIPFKTFPLYLLLPAITHYFLES